MDLSVIIPVKDDVLVEQCVKSIDEDVEIVVVLNGTNQKIKEIVSKLNVKILEIEEANLAKALNYGIITAKNDRVLLMDSDCIFEKGTIEKIYRGLDVAALSKGKVIFKSNGIISETIAKVRSFSTSDFCNAYKPPLAFNKNIIQKIGYYFDPKLIWEEDLDFNNRVISNKLKINWDQTAKIYHPKLKLINDLKAAYNYGTGHAYGIINGNFKKIQNVDEKKIKLFQKRFLIETKGYLAYLYYILWQYFYKKGMRKILKRGDNKK